MVKGAASAVAVLGATLIALVGMAAASAEDGPAAPEDVVTTVTEVVPTGEALPRGPHPSGPAPVLDENQGRPAEDTSPALTEIVDHATGDVASAPPASAETVAQATSEVAGTTLEVVETVLPAGETEIVGSSLQTAETALEELVAAAPDPVGGLVQLAPPPVSNPIDLATNRLPAATSPPGRGGSGAVLAEPAATESVSPGLVIEGPAAVVAEQEGRTPAGSVGSRSERDVQARVGGWAPVVASPFAAASALASLEESRGAPFTPPPLLTLAGGGISFTTTSSANAWAALAAIAGALAVSLSCWHRGDALRRPSSLAYAPIPPPG